MSKDGSSELIKAQVIALVPELNDVPGAVSKIAPMDIYAIRKSNLELLRRKFAKRCARQGIRYTQRNFSLGYGLDPSLCSQILHGVRNLGDDVARKMEKHGNLDAGWMDSLKTDVNPRTLEEKDTIERTLRLFRRSPEKLRKALLDAMDQLLQEGSDDE